MKVFISYSTDDIKLVHQIANYIKPHAEVFYWHNSKVPGQESWPSIFQWIDESDIVLAVITDKTVSRAMSVGQEIGHSKAKCKTIIPMVSPDVQNSDLGCLSGITYQPILRDNPGPALKVIEKLIMGKKQRLEIQQSVLIFGGVLFLIWLASTNKA